MAYASQGCSDPSSGRNTTRDLHTELARRVGQAYATSAGREGDRTRLDRGDEFKILASETLSGEEARPEDLTGKYAYDGGEVAADGEAYAFTARRFLNGTPAEKLTGTAYKMDDQWVITIDERPGIIARIRDALPF